MKKMLMVLGVAATVLVSSGAFAVELGSVSTGTEVTLWKQEMATKNAQKVTCPYGLLGFSLPEGDTLWYAIAWQRVDFQRGSWGWVPTCVAEQTTVAEVGSYDVINSVYCGRNSNDSDWQHAVVNANQTTYLEHRPLHCR